MTSWPSTLPLPRATGAGDVPGVRAKRFQPDEGLPKQRTVTTAALDTLTLVYRCSASQRSTLLGFFKGDGGGGGVWFTYKHPFTGSVVNARFVADKPPATSVVSPWFDVSVTLEVDGE